MGGRLVSVRCTGTSRLPKRAAQVWRYRPGELRLRLVSTNPARSLPYCQTPSDQGIQQAYSPSAQASQPAPRRRLDVAMADSIQEVALQETVRHMNWQQQAFESLRARAGVLLSSTTLATAFFGGQALHGHVSNGVVVAAIILFVGVGVCAVAILWPRRNWRFTIPPEEFLSEQALDHATDPAVVAAALGRLSIELGRHARENDRRLDQLFLLLSAGCVLFLGEILAWLAQLFL